MELAALALLILGAWLWLDSTRVRELAVAAARVACEAENVLFLDDTVAFKSMTLMRSAEGRVQIRRAYDFEFSDTGNNRLRGGVVMAGERVMLLNVGAPRLHVVAGSALREIQ